MKNHKETHFICRSNILEIFFMSVCPHLCSRGMLLYIGMCSITFHKKTNVVLVLDSCTGPILFSISDISACGSDFMSIACHKNRNAILALDSNTRPILHLLALVSFWFILDRNSLITYLLISKSHFCLACYFWVKGSWKFPREHVFVLLVWMETLVPVAVVYSLNISAILTEA